MPEVRRVENPPTLLELVRGNAKAGDLFGSVGTLAGRKFQRPVTGVLLVPRPGKGVQISGLKSRCICREPADQQPSGNERETLHCLHQDT